MKNSYLVIGVFMTAILIILIFFGSHLPFVDTSLEGERVIIHGPGKIDTAPFPPSKEFVLGSDREGRDLLSLIIMGTKDTLVLIFAVTFLRYIVAVPLALMAANNRGPVTWMLKWWNHIFSCLPVIFSAIILVNLPFLLFSESRFLWCVVILALIEVGRVGYILQQQAHALSKAPFVEAGITIGVGPLGIYSRYYVPNLLPDIIVNFFIDLGRVTLLIGQLGIFSIFITQEFVQLNLGYGEFINTNINWTTLLGNPRTDVLKAVWIPLFPALAITYTILTFNVLGEGLRQYFNRKTA